jgi:hypothetical protein
MVLGLSWPWKECRYWKKRHGGGEGSCLSSITCDGDEWQRALVVRQLEGDGGSRCPSGSSWKYGSIMFPTTS